MKSNLRHLRIFLAVCDTASISRAAALCNVSQPAVTQVIGKLERVAGQPLFLRRPRGMFMTAAGQALAGRVTRAFAYLDRALGDLNPRLRLTATAAQLQALIAMREAENFTLAARRGGGGPPPGGGGGPRPRSGRGGGPGPRRRCIAPSPNSCRRLAARCSSARPTG